jgi:amino acid adenylation domain-containing protein
MPDDVAMTPMQQAVVALRTQRARIAELEQAASAPIAIIGMACRYPADATSPEALWEALASGRDGAREVPPDRWDIDELYDPTPGTAGRMYVRRSCFIDGVDQFEPLFFRISPREAVGIDPQQRLLLETTWEALEDAAIPPPSLVGSQTGVFIGISTNDYSALLSRTAHGSGSNASAGAGNAASVASGRLSYTFGFHGPCMAVDTACSSSLVATHLAVQALRARECSLAVVAGVNLMLTPDITVNFCLGRMLSPDGACKTFDEGADGYVRGEGCGALILKRLSDAQADGNRILAVIRGSALNQDGRSAGLTAPNGLAQEAVIRKALANAGLRPDDIDCIEAHGTGTALGDPIEMHALRAVFAGRSRPLHVGSVKTNIGHTEAAAGAAGLIKAVQVLRHQALPPTLHFRRLNPHIDLGGVDIRVPTALTPTEIRAIGVSSFGFSGTNAHIVLERAIEPARAVAPANDAAQAHRLFLSARTEPALRALIDCYRNFLATTPESFADICHTASAGRARLPWWVMVDSPEALATAVPSKAPPPAVPPTEGRRVALPRTVFQRERFWIDAPADPGEAGSAPGPAEPGTSRNQAAPLAAKFAETTLPPLLGRPVSLPFASERRWESAITSQHPALKFLAQHVVDGVPLVPAACFIEMALAAHPGSALTNIRLPAPLRLTGAEQRIVHTIALPDGTFRIASCAPDGSDPVLHAYGRTAPLTATAGIPVPPLASTPVDAGALYEAMARRGVAHGPAFRLLDGIRRDEGHASAILRAAPGVEGRFVIHPARLDAALQLAGAALPDLDEDAFVPASVGRIALHRPPAAAATVHAFVQRVPEGVRADVMVLDGGRIALEVSDVLFRPAATCEAAGLYRIDWRAQPLLEGLAAPDFLPAPAELASALARASVTLGEQHGAAAYAGATPTLEAAATAYGVTALRRLGLPLTAGTEFTFAATAETLGIAEHHHRLFRRILGMLAEDGVLSGKGRRWRVRQTPADTDPEALVQDLLARTPAMAEEIAVLRRCGTALADVLAGRLEPLTLLFPAEGAGAGAFYETSPYARTVNGLLTEAVGWLAASLPAGRVLRVLEAGAGTGGATSALLPALSRGRRHYVFTDLSAGFLTAARRKFAAEGLETRLLDVERPPLDQGYAPEGFDLILAANVLHATTDIGRSLSHLRVLLAPGGMLLLVESTEPRRWVDIVFGLTEGWWRFTDTARRPDHPLLSREAWRRALTEAGFEAPEVTSEVIVARRPLGAEAAAPGDGRTGLPAGAVFPSRPGRSSRPDDQKVHGAAALEPGSFIFTRPTAFTRMTASHPEPALEPSQGEGTVLAHVVGPTEPTEDSQVALLASLARLAVAATRISPAPQLVLVGNDSLGHAGLPGFVRTLALEAPSLRPRLLICPPGLAALADEIASGALETEIRWDTAGQRQMPRLVPAGTGGAPRIEGTWLVTGASGGVAQAIATWLSGRGASGIVLLSRRSTSLSLPGSSIHAYAGDAADPDLIGELLRQHDVQGVVSAAGMLADAALPEQDEATIRIVAHAKIATALALDAATRVYPVQHFILCASAAGILGSARQANHAFCSSFLDGLAARRRAEGLPALSIDWGVWSGTGSAAALGFDAQAERLGLGSIAPERGVALFGHALGSSCGQLVALPGVNWPRFTAHFGDAIPGLFRDVAATGQEPTLPNSSRTITQTAANSGPLQLPAGPTPAAALTAIVSACLGLSSPPDPDTPLHDFGLDSLVAVEIRNRAERELGLAVSVRELIEGATIRSLLGHVVTVQSTPAAQPLLPDPSSVLAAIVAASLGLNAPPDPDTPLHDLGLDSLVAVEIRNRAERELGLTVSVRELIEGATIRALRARLPQAPGISSPAMPPAVGSAPDASVSAGHAPARISPVRRGAGDASPVPTPPASDAPATPPTSDLHAAAYPLAPQAAPWGDAPTPRSASTLSLPVAIPSPPYPAANDGIKPDLANRYEPFPLTDIQMAYYLGRRNDLALGAIGCYLYTEFDTDQVDLARAEASWNRLIARHDMLRVVIRPDATQQILQDVPYYAFQTLDLRGQDPAPQLERLRRSLPQRVVAPNAWPLFDIRVTLFENETGRSQARLHMGFDLIALDAASIHAVRREWGLLYDDPDTVLRPIGVSFRDVVLAQHAARGSPSRRRAEAYWKARALTLPPGPDLPTTEAMGQSSRRFRRRGVVVDPASAAALRRQAQARGLTLPMLLAAAYADTLAAWSRSSRFSLTVTSFNRPDLHPDMPMVLGDYTSTILLEVDAAAPKFADRARRLAGQLASDLEHAEVGGIEVLREIARQTASPAPLIPVVFTSALGFTRPGARREKVGSGGWDRLGTTVYNVSSTPQVLIDQQVSEEDGQLFCNWDVAEDMFPPGVVDAMVAAYSGLLRTLADGSGWDRPVAEILPPQSRPALAYIPPPELLHAGFERMAREHPHRPAVIASDAILDYATLDTAASHLAAEVLTRLGGEPHDRLVAIVLPKGWRQIVAVLAVLKAGAAYLPVDPGLPADRRRLLIESGEAIVLDDPATVDTALARTAGPRPVLPPVEDPSRLAYVIYTSGSTGQPKGVMIEHRAALATVREVNRRWAIGPDDRAIGLSSLSFDLSVWDIFGPLSVGGALVLSAPDATRDPSYWAELLVRYQVTVWNSVPALMAMQVEHGLPAGHSLRLVLMSGDWVPIELVERLRAEAPSASLVALGGATEATIWSNAYEIIGPLDSEWPSIPYGTPLAGQKLHVVNARGEPCPDWTPGEIEISGAGLARGYWRDSEQTAERFRTDVSTGERRYRTGDLGRFRSYRGWDGPTPIEFLGREDFQVKVQGHRIELGEVEAALASHPAVAQAVATAPAGANGRDRTLHGFVVLHGQEEFPPRQKDARSDMTDPESKGHPGVARRLEWDTLCETAQSALAQCARPIARDDFDLTAATFTDQAVAAAALALHRLTGSYELPDAETLIRDHGVAARYRFWLERMLPEVARVGMGAIPVSSRAIRGVDRFGFAEESLDFLDRVIAKLPDILTEREHSSAIYLDDGTPDVYARLFATPNAVIGSIITALAAARPISVLEVGGGLGTTLAAIEALLPADRVTWHFTDINRHLLRAAAAKFSGRDWISFGTLDIDQLPASAHLRRYDVVVASNALHVASAVVPALGNLKACLAPGGILIALEQTRFFPWFDLGMGLQSGFDSRTDLTLRPNHPLLSRAGWARVFEEAGFTASSPVVAPGSLEDLMGYDLLLARDEPARAATPDPGLPEILREHVRARLPAYMVPATVTVIDRVPLSANGKVDRRALVPATMNRPAQAAATRLEEEIGAVVAELLHTDHVDPHRSLFELGASSLTLVSLQRLLGERLGRVIPLQQLFANPTVAAFAEEVADSRTASSPLVTFDAHDDDRPKLVMMAGVFSLPFYLREMAEATARDLAIVSVQLPGMAEGEIPIDSVPGQAEYVVERLRIAGLEPPYLIGGHSFGGRVAIEVARILRDAGEPVPLLLLGDTIRTYTDFNVFQTDEMAYTAMTRGLYALYGRLTKVPYEAMDGLTPGEKFRATAERMQAEGLFGALDLPLERMVNVFKANFRAIGSFSPKPISGDLAVLRTEGGFPPEFFDYESGEQLKDPALGWSDLVEGRVTVRTMPGDHLAMLNPANLPVMADIMVELVQEALSGYLRSLGLTPDRGASPRALLRAIRRQRAGVA